MPSSLATVLTFAFVFFMMRRETKGDEEVSPALWLPVIWLSISGSRYLSQWLALGQPDVTGNVTDGSPLDAIFFLCLICAGGCVLLRRQLAFGSLVRQNAWVFAFIALGLVSILWSDFPFIAFKRWVKTLGHPIMALIILTDPRPLRALQIVLKRCAFLLLPFSVLFIKYLPQYGRGYDAFTGEPVEFGVGLTKNDLGYVSMAMSIFFAWSFLQARKLADRRQRREEMLVCVVFLCMAIWLLGRSNSATSLVTMILGVTVILLLGTRLINKRHIGVYVVVGILLGCALQAIFDIYEAVITALGRDPNLTDRTEVWADVIELQSRPLIGAGFESFWLGERLDVMWAKWWWRPSQAHNGYLETYLHLGLIGVTCLVAMIISAFRKISKRLTDDFELARFRLALLMVIVVFNYTEAGFKALHFMWTLFYVIAIEYTKPEPAKVAGQRGMVPRPMAPATPYKSPRQIT